MNSSVSIIDFVKRLQITEKGTRGEQGKQPKYLFRAIPSANKLQIKQAVEKFFGVKVAKVNTMNYLGKKKRLRTQRYGMTSDWKRAVVTLKEGGKIETAQ